MDNNNETTAAACPADKALVYQLVVYTMIIGPLCLFGVTANTLSYVILRAESSTRSTVVSAGVYLLKVLAVVDNALLVYSLGLLSTWIGLVGYLRHSYGVASYQYDDSWRYLFTVVLPTGPLLQSLVIWITVLLAFNRYAAVCHPLHAGRLCTLHRTRIQMAVVVVLLVGFTAPTYFQYWLVEEVHYDNSTGQNETKYYASTGIDLGILDLVHTKIFSAVFIHLLPLVLLIYMNLKVFCGLRALRSRNVKQNISRSSAAVSAERNLNRVMILVVLVFIVCQMPDRLFTAVDPSKGGEYPSCTVLLVAYVCDILVVVNSSTNFFIYFVIRKNFRKVFIEKYCSCIVKVPLDRNVSSRSTKVTDT